MARTPTRKLDVFQRQSDLEKLLRDLKKLNTDALVVLQKGLESEDEKIRVTCADKILSFTASIAKDVSNDQLNRKIASIRFDADKNLTAVPKNNQPVLAFDTIPEEFQEKEQITTVSFNHVKNIG